MKKLFFDLDDLLNVVNEDYKNPVHLVHWAQQFQGFSKSGRKGKGVF